MSQELTVASDRPARAVAPWLFATFLGFYALFAGGHLYTGDAQTILATDRSLLSGAGFAIPFDRTYGGAFAPDHKFYAQYGLGAVLTALAPAAVGRFLCPAPASKSERLAAELPFALWNLPFAAGCIAMFFAVCRRLGYAEPVALVLSCAAGVGTMIWPYAARDFTEPQVALLLLAAYHQLLVVEQGGGAGHAALAGLTLGYALLTKVYVVVLIPLFLYELWRAASGEPRSLTAFSLPLGAAALAIAAYDYARFGNPFVTGYSSQVQNTHIPLWEGAYGLLFSSGKSLFLYNPPLGLSLAGAPELHRRRPEASRFIWILAALHVAFFGIQQNWHGDWSWGPRYLLPAALFLLLAAAPVTERLLDPRKPAKPAKLLWLTAVGAGICIQVLGVTVNPNDYVRYLADHKALLGDYLSDYKEKVYVPFHQQLWNPDLSPVRGHWHLFRSALGLASGGFILHSSAEEWNDEKGHRLLPLLDLGPAGARGGSLDLWFVSLPRVLPASSSSRLLLPYGSMALILVGLGIPRLARALRLSLKEARRPGPGPRPQEPAP